MEKFFVGCNIQFEEELEKELKEIWPFLLDLDGRPHSTAFTVLETVPGGLLLEAPFHIGLQINFFSKLANRVLLRLAEFRVRDFPKLFQKFTDLKKNPLLLGLKLQFEVAAQESRLNNEKRILEILKEIFGNPPKEPNQSLYVRMSQDLCTVSLDSSGTHLHKRSDRIVAGEAPLRETLAAFCARQLTGDRTAQELHEISLIDPMAGTGTLLSEAAQLYRPSERTQFAFLAWKQCPKLFLTPTFRANFAGLPFLFRDLLAADSDALMLPLAKKQLGEIDLPSKVIQQDLFAAKPAAKTKCWVISNPPYGERLKANFTSVQLIEKISEVYSPEKIGLIFSERQVHALSEKIKGYHLESRSSFSNGGLKVQFLVYSL